MSAPSRLADCNRGDTLVCGYACLRSIVTVHRVSPRRIYVLTPSGEHSFWMHSGLLVGDKHESTWVRIPRDGEVLEIEVIEERRELISELDSIQWAAMSLRDLRRIKSAIESTKKAAAGKS